MVQILISPSAVGTVERNVVPEIGGGEVCSYRQMGQGDGLIAKWNGAQVSRFSSG